MESSGNLDLSSTPRNPAVPPSTSKSDENDRNRHPPSNEAMDLKFSRENPSSEIPNNADVKPFSCNEDSEMELPYDPLTNYLSPRPKFLRYKPSRRREIFLRRVREENSGIGEGFLRTVGEDSALVPHTSFSGEEMQEKEKLEGKSSEIDEEIEEEEEEEEESEGDENRGFTVKELLKFLLVIACLALCTAYITSENTPMPSFEVSGAFRSGFCPILNNTDEFRSSVVVEPLNANGSNFWDEEVTEAASNMDFDGVSPFVHHHEHESNTGFIEETEILNGENEGKAAYGDLVMLKYTEQVEQVREKTPAGESITEEMAEGEENGVQSSELLFEDDGDQEKGNESEISNRKSEDEIIEASNINGFDEDNLLSDILTVAENEYTSQMEAVEKEEAGDWEMIERNTEEAESFVLEASQITILERIANCISSFVKDFEKLKSEYSELMHPATESVLKAFLGISVSSAILTFLVLSIKFKQKKGYKKEPAVTASVKPILLQSSVAEAEKVITKELPSIQPTCDVDKSNNEPIRNVGSFKMLSSSIHSRDKMEGFKEIYHHEAPTVQFLGEFVVGEISNSLKNKSRLKNRAIEVEDSNFHVTVEEKPVSKNMNSGPEQALSEFSTTTSPTYGSFTTSKKKIVKKEVVGDAEVKSFPTPVRRSTRIRNRIVSP